MPSTFEINKTKQNGGLLESVSPLKFSNIPSTCPKKRVNVFKSYRPKKDEVLDYHISETFLQMEHIGTQIKYRETKAEYVPAPEEHLKKQQMKKKIVYSHGAPPQWEFIDETWLQNQNKLQEVYKTEFREFLKKRKSQKKDLNKYRHFIRQSLCGPEWYQELSPKQIKTVNTLHDCIKKDRKSGKVIFTKEAIAQLGLVCRPHHKKIELALRYCCGCPVEFLFILYQLLDPKRKKYSLNDRLLLSAVVHLTICKTLRELHIRIPSPVRELKKTSCSTKHKQKKKKYASPYLVPNSFKPEPVKFSGNELKRNIQYPESPYFDYLEYFKVEKSKAQDYSEVELGDLEENEKQLVEETIQAQKMYNDMHNSRNLILLKPTIWQSCTDFKTYKEEKKAKKVTRNPLPPLPTIEISEKCCVCPPEVEIEPEQVNENNVTCDKCKYETPKPTVSSFCAECKHQKINSIVAGITIIGCNEIIPIHGGMYFDATCVCQEKLEKQLIFLKKKKNLERSLPKYVINGVVITPFGPVFSFSTAIWNNRLKNLLRNNSLEVKNEKRTKNEIKTCNNTDQNEESADENFCSCQNRGNSEKLETSSSETTPLDGCECEKALDNFLNKQCKCEECNIDNRRKNATYILAGTAEFDNEPSSKIIHGVQDYQCNCLESYVKKMKRVEEYRQRCQAAYQLRKRGIKYALSGVTCTEKGPIYQIAGMRPPVQCICGEILEEEAQLREEHRRQPKMPPTGRIKYGIGGVKETPEENFYIITQALESGKCQCEKLYEDFLTEHKNCWEAYEHFLEQTNIEKDYYFKDQEYFESFEEQNNEREETSSNDEMEDKYHDNDEVTPESHEMLNNSETDKSKDPYLQHITDQNECQCDFDNRSFNYKQRKTNASVEQESSESHKHYKQKKQKKPPNSFEKEIDEECPCECNRSDSLPYDPQYTIHLDHESETPIEEITCFRPDEPTESKIEIRRFILLKKIPKELSSQRAIVRKALHTMASDGFPLAKLPDSYKLPHLKLWMQLRSGKFWTPKDRKNYEYFSKMCWKHNKVCYNPVPLPKVDFSNSVLKKLTWNSAERCKQFLEDKRYKFRRSLRQHFVDKNREFFPSMFMYEFPMRTFRKCYAAYLPHKEEDQMIYSSNYS